MTKKLEYEAANELSDELKQLINKVNLVPMNAEFFAPDVDFRHECLETLFFSHKENPDAVFGKARVSNWIAKNRRWLEMALENLPVEFQKHILENELTASFIEQLDKEFDTSNFYKFLQTDFVLRSETLDSLLQLIQSQFKYEESYKLTNQFYFLIGLSSQPITQASKIKTVFSTSTNARYLFLNKANFEMDDDGIFHASLDEFLSAVNNKNISRIRICNSCFEVFWANRIDAKCCSKKCLNLFHVKKSKSHRQNDSDYIWKQDMKKRARETAEKHLEKLKFTNADINEYLQKHRRLPRQVIYDYLVNEALKPDTKKSVENLKIPAEVVQPLLDFLKTLDALRGSGGGRGGGRVGDVLIRRKTSAAN